MIKKTLLLLLFLTRFSMEAGAQILSDTPTAFDLGRATIYVDKNDFPVVQKSAELLSRDIEKVTGRKVPVVNAPVRETGSSLARQKNRRKLKA